MGNEEYCTTCGLWNPDMASDSKAKVKAIFEDVKAILSELDVLTQICEDQSMSLDDTLTKELNEWQEQKNEASTLKALEDAKIKLVGIHQKWNVLYEHEVEMCANDGRRRLA